ncbi:MAG: thioredoxin domain-containing protein [Verrucomicrobiota bacterium]
MPHPPNHLAGEASPYLRQHLHNPVDWYPWGEAAFARARELDRPILLSIGYSTCHWCHVMERESFESEAIAALLNQHFVSIKVDREERPDVDQIYMAAYQALSSEGGGWPLHLFLTPELEPFYGGTYFPPQPAHGRASFTMVLESLHHTWTHERAKVRQHGAQTAQQLRHALAADPPSPDPELASHLLPRALEELQRGYDREQGGWGRAPKFPRPSHPLFLLHQGWLQGEEAALEQVITTARRMQEGGIFDQLGGGFARYAVDREWLVPHFEKMLYDNAQLVHLYLDLWGLTGEESFAQTARDTLDYLLRDMTHAQGGFFSAEDADSEGKEGKFYTWTLAEIAELLGDDQLLDLATRHYGLTPSGNFLDHSDPQPLLNQNVLHQAIPFRQLTPDEQETLPQIRAQLLEARSQRIRPGLDDKILTSWNGLMLGACARAGLLLQEERYAQAARENLAFLRKALWDSRSKRLSHRWHEGHRDRAQLLEDYAFLLEGLLWHYQSTLEAGTLAWAIEISESMIARFHDPKAGGFFQAPEQEDLFVRMKPDWDGATPAENSVALRSLLRLAEITGQNRYRELAENTLAYFADTLERSPHALPSMLLGLSEMQTGFTRIVLVGDPQASQTRALLRASLAAPGPARLVLGTEGPVDPFTATLAHQATRPTAFVCQGRQCLLPTSDPAQLAQNLSQRAAQP